MLITLGVISGEAAAVAISDTERTRSPSPSSHRRPRGHVERGRNSHLTKGAHEKSPAAPRYQPLQSKAEQTGLPRLALKSISDATLGSSPPAPPGSGHHVLSSGPLNGVRRPRPETSHQKAVNINRKMRMDHILHKQLMSSQREIRHEKRKILGSFGLQVMSRLHRYSDMYDSDDENALGPGGLVPSSSEKEDFGEEAIRHKTAIDRALRRLFREDNGGSAAVALRAEERRHRKTREPVEADPQPSVRKRRKYVRRAPPRPRHQKVIVEPVVDEDLDELDLDLLGENREEGEDHSDAESVNDASEAPDGDMTEEDVTMEG